MASEGGEAPAQAKLSGSVREDWGAGGVVDVRIDAVQPVNGWQVEIDVGGEVVNLWNARVLSAEGTRYTFGPAEYNAQIQAGRSIDFGFEVSGGVSFEPLGLDVSLAADVAAQTSVRTSTATALASAAEQDTQTASADERDVAEPASGLARTLRDDGSPAEAATVGDGPPEVHPEAQPASLTVSSPRVDEPAATGPSGIVEPSPFSPPFSTRGTQIVDANGEPVTLHGINWFGLETEIFAPHGLWARNWREMMDEVRGLGFNAVRLPLSGELVASGGGKASGIDAALNPDLAGLNGLEILDAIVAYAHTIGLKVLLDYHRGSPGGGPNENGLWFGNGRTEADVIAEWQALAERYGDDPAVIGADLLNEPFMATWGDGSATDWAAAAERIGNAVLKIAPHWLIVVEGVATYEGEPYWWAGNLQGVRDRPVRLDVPDKLVYSPHDYPPSVHEQDWFSDGTPLEELFRRNWGFLVEEGIAPVLLGEWGSRLTQEADEPWAQALSAYLERHDVPWLWWALNPNSRDTGGLYADDWTTIRAPVVDLLSPFLQETQPELDVARGEVRFDLTLATPADEAIELTYATADGTATAGADYVASAGNITIPPGESAAQVVVPVLGDALAEGDEFFYLVIGGSDAQHGSATAVIADAQTRRPSTQPTIDVASTVVPADASVARFRIVLSEPLERDASVDYLAGPSDADPSAARKGSVILPAGTSERTLEIDIEGDADGAAPGGASAGSDGEAKAAPPQRFTLELTAADGAQIRTGRAEAIVGAQPLGAGKIASPPNATGEVALTIDLILKNDWGTGALFDVVLRNVSDAPVEGWTLALDLPFDLAEVWSATIESDVGERVTLTNAQWNGAIAPGGTATFGFIADAGEIALEALIAAADLELVAQ